MPIYPPTPRAAYRSTATMHAFVAPGSPAPTPQIPNVPGNASVTQGSGGGLTVAWAAPTIDGAHDAATRFNLQSSPSGADAWTIVSGAISPYTLSGLPAGAAIDVQLQSANAAGSSAWSGTITLTTATAAPCAPGAGSLAQGTGSDLSVTWTAPAVDSTHNAATRFNLRSSPSGAGSWTTVSGVTSPYDLSGLTSGTAVDVQLQSANAGGVSAWSATSTLSTAVGPLIPNTPAGASLAVGAGSTLIVTWLAPAIDSTHSAASGFNLRSSPSGAGTWTTVSGAVSPYTLSGLGAGTAIDVQLQSANAAGGSAWSATSTLTTATAAPNTPDAALLAQGSGSNLTATWVAPAIDATHNPASAVNLRFSPSGAGTWTTVSGVVSPYTLSGLAAGSAIDVQLQGSNAAGGSAWSATSTLTTATAAPNTPGAALLAQGTGSNLTVTWIAPAIDATHNAASAFNLRSSPSGAGTWTIVSGIAGPYTLSGLAAGTAIDVQLQGSNAGGASAWSVTSTLTTATAAPNTPAAASLAQGVGCDLTVTWTAPGIDGAHNAATGFNLRSSPSGAGTWTTAAGVISPYDLSGLAAAAAIDVQLQGVNTAGTSAWSATSTLTTAAIGPFAPNAPVIANVAPLPDGTNTKLGVSWPAPASDSTHNAATGFNLRFGPHGAGTWTTVSGVSSPYTLTGLAGATAIDVEVQATNAAASPSAWSAAATGTTWGSIVTPGTWQPAASQVHNTSVAPNGGVQMFATPSPTAATGAAFAWSASNSTVPTTGLIATTANGQTNGWGQWFNAPATAGTFYLWSLAQGTGATTIGALVTSIITVT